MGLPTFEVDKQGLRKLLERRGKEFAVVELIQNAWDENTSNVNVYLDPSKDKGYYDLRVEDDNPAGFVNLTHAWTLFAESDKKKDVTKRGRFNLGEKLVIALCENVVIATTKGTVFFDSDGRRIENGPQWKLRSGTTFSGVIKMTGDEARACADLIQSLIPPKHIKTYFMGIRVGHYKEPLVSFEGFLPTEIADEEGYLRASIRKTKVNVYEIQNDEPALLYEMGIPVVETGDRYHIDVQQKVPLNTDRDNVTPSYLRKVRTLVLEHTADILEADGVAETWVNEALPMASAEVVDTVLTKRFGERRVIFDPSDMEANKIATAQGYTVIPPRSFTSDAWANIKTSGAVKPAGQVTPSPKPFSEDGRALRILPYEKWTPGIKMSVEFIEELAQEILGRSIRVEIATDVGWSCAAAYGPDGILYLNLARLGHGWFDGEPLDQLPTLIHEFAHEKVSDHLSREFYDECCRLGTVMVKLAANGGFTFRKRTIVRRRDLV